MKEIIINLLADRIESLENALNFKWFYDFRTANELINLQNAQTSNIITHSKNDIFYKNKFALTCTNDINLDNFISLQTNAS